MNARDLPAESRSRGEPRSRETAASHLCGDVVIAGPDEPVGAVLERVRRRPETAEHGIYVTDPSGKLTGSTTVARLLASDPSARIAECASTPAPTARADLDQEHVAALALHHDLLSVPVADQEGKFLGVVPASVLMHVLRREHVEDLHRLAGIHREERHLRQVMSAPPVRQFRDRFPWLLIGFLGSAVATLLASSFESVLSRKLSLSFFVPAIVYLADAIGTQTETIVVRGLSLSGARFIDLFWRELGTGALLGAALGTLGFSFAQIAFGDVRLALSVGLALFTAGAAATSIGLLLPWLLHRAGKDPAFGSGPLATVVQDVLSLWIYFAIAAFLIGH